MIDYINPYKRYSYSINNDITKFFFPKILNNYNQFKNERIKLFNFYDSNYENTYIEIQNEYTNSSLNCTFYSLLEYLKSEKICLIVDKAAETIDIEKTYTNWKKLKELVVNNAINILSKSFVPLYKSFTQISFGNIIEFFCKLNENIQVKLIEEYFPSFYKNIRKLSRNNKNFALVLISTFISFLNVFKNLRNKVAHHDVIYNFWDIYVPINSKSSKLVAIRNKDFWMCNKDTCKLFNEILNTKNVNFLSNYFVQLKDRSWKFYLDKIDSLNVKVFCSYNKDKYDNLIFVKKRQNSDIWHLPLFFLSDVINWLCIFIDEQNNFVKIVNKIIKQTKMKNEEIINRLKDFLFHKIIIQFEKDNE